MVAFAVPAGPVRVATWLHLVLTHPPPLADSLSECWSADCAAGARYSLPSRPRAVWRKIAISECFIDRAVCICHRGIGDRCSGNAGKGACIKKMDAAQSGRPAEQVRAARRILPSHRKTPSGMEASPRSHHGKVPRRNNAEASQAAAQVCLGSFGHLACDGIRDPSDMYLVFSWLGGSNGQLQMGGFRRMKEALH